MKIFKNIVIVTMLVDFFVLAATGIVKFPETQKFFVFSYDYISASRLSLIHDWSGIILVVLIIIHLILKRSWFSELFSGDRPLSDRSAKVAYIILAVLLIVLGTSYLSRQFGSPKTTDLSAVEVTEYQGEKLGSLSDFRENSIKGVQYLDRNQYKLEVTGLVGHPASYGYAELLKFPAYQKVVTLNCVEDWSVKVLWKGILVRDLFKDLDVKPEAKAVIFYAADGYSTSFPLDYFMQNDILMAYDLNGVELPPERGFPFQLVAEQKWGYKWIKWITKIELSDNTDYKGFWESYGYNNSGDLSGSKYQNN